MQWLIAEQGTPPLLGVPVFELQFTLLLGSRDSGTFGKSNLEKCKTE